MRLVGLGKGRLREMLAERTKSYIGPDKTDPTGLVGALQRSLSISESPRGECEALVIL